MWAETSRKQVAMEKQVVAVTTWVVIVVMLLVLVFTAREIAAGFETAVAETVAGAVTY